MFTNKSKIKKLAALLFSLFAVSANSSYGMKQKLGCKKNLAISIKSDKIIPELDVIPESPNDDSTEQSETDSRQVTHVLTSQRLSATIQRFPNFMESIKNNNLTYTNYLNKKTSPHLDKINSNVKKKKKVKFADKLTVIDIENFKEFTKDNTAKDPFEKRDTTNNLASMSDKNDRKTINVRETLNKRDKEHTQSSVREHKDTSNNYKLLGINTYRKLNVLNKDDKRTKNILETSNRHAKGNAQLYSRANENMPNKSEFSGLYNIKNEVDPYFQEINRILEEKKGEKLGPRYLAKCIAKLNKAIKLYNNKIGKELKCYCKEEYDKIPDGQVCQFDLRNLVSRNLHKDIHDFDFLLVDSFTIKTIEKLSDKLRKFRIIKAESTFPVSETFKFILNYYDKICKQAISKLGIQYRNER